MSDVQTANHMVVPVNRAVLVSDELSRPRWTRPVNVCGEDSLNALVWMRKKKRTKRIPLVGESMRDICVVRPSTSVPCRRRAG
jgi:hypothetical protein